MLYFFWKIKIKTWRYHYFTPVYRNIWWYDLRFMRYRVWQTEINNHGSFFTLLLLPKAQKIRILKKCKILLKISSFCTCVRKTTVIWGKVPETLSETERIFCQFFYHFLSFYPPKKPENQYFEKWKKGSGDFIILHMCTKNSDNMM